MNYPSLVSLREVAPRDGWQKFKTVLPTEVKRELICSMIDYGARELEIGVFSSDPVRGRQYQDLDSLCQMVLPYAAEKGVRVTALVESVEAAVEFAGRIGYPVDAPTSMHHGMHAHLENELDAILLWKYKKKKPSEFNQTATICLNGQEIQFISHFLASCINETYYPITYRNNFQVTPAMVHRSIWALRFGCRTLSDKNGKKKFGIAQVESIFVNHPVASAKMVTDSVTDYRSSCNLNHEAWGNPWDPTRVSTASFVDLFHETLDKCSRVYALLNSAVTDNMPLDKQDLSPLLAELGNESYHSGLPVE